MNEKVKAVLEEYQARLDREDPVVLGFSREEYLERRDEYLLGVGADTGRFLNILIKATRPKVIVEAGTSYGYSTLWLADAAQSAGATVISCETADKKVAFAREMLTRAGLEKCVEFVVGDVRETIPKLALSIDFVLIDLWKELYIPTFDLVYPKLADGALVTADNMLRPALHAEAGAKYIAHVRAQKGIESVTVPTGTGVELSRYSRNRG